MCFPTTAVASKKNKNEEKKTNLFNKATIILTKVIVYLSLRVGCFLLFFRTDAQIVVKFLHWCGAFLSFISHCPSKPRFWKKCPVTSVSVWVQKMVCQFFFLLFLNPLRTGSHHLPVMLTDWNLHLEYKDLTSWRYRLILICFGCLQFLMHFPPFFLNFFFFKCTIKPYVSFVTPCRTLNLLFVFLLHLSP